QFHILTARGARFLQGAGAPPPALTGSRLSRALAAGAALERRLSRSGEWQGSVRPCFAQQRVQIERSGHRDVQGTVSAARPLIEWAIAGELHAVSVGVGEID